MEEIVKQDDVECTRNTVNATETATGKNISFSGICMARVKDGKIVEAWNSYDFQSMYEQVGFKLVKVE